MPSSNAVSAPGKVLLAGGYLVLDRQYTGLVFALNARIHTHIQSLPTTEGVSIQEIIVRSPQFQDASWRYGYNTAQNGGGVAVTQLRAGRDVDAQRNVFVETALSYALTYIAALLNSPAFDHACITILADEDYYSHPGGRVTAGFTDFDVPLFQAHKTGLGSSAALVTSFIAAVLQHYLPEDRLSLETDHGKERLHNLAQAAHSAAQGKIGSGFDVASATYGSCAYRRFSPSILEAVGEHGLPDFAQKLLAAVNNQPPSPAWNTEIKKSTLARPKGIRLVMCDVDCGSKTPGMVKKLLVWRKRSPDEADSIWSQLQAKNEALAIELVRLSTSEYSFEPLRHLILDIRRLVQTMSSKSQVPVEPEVISKLLDTCSSQKGVIGGLAPGAGGFDAVVLLIEDKAEVFDSLNTLLTGWKGDGIGKVRLLGVREEMEGVRTEAADQYRAWTG